MPFYAAKFFFTVSLKVADVSHDAFNSLFISNYSQTCQYIRFAL